MGDNIDEALASMTPRELAALEGEIDKRATDLSAAYHFGLGMKIARESLETFEKTGEISPALFLAKAATDAETENSEIDTFLDQCSANDLTEIEENLDAKLSTKSAEDEFAAEYFEIGRKMASVMAKKGAAAPGFLRALSGALGGKGKGPMGFGQFAAAHPLVTTGAGLYAGKKLMERE